MKMTSKQKTRALLVCIDGADGTGKSKIAQEVVNQLNNKGVTTFLTKEPYADDSTYKLIKDLSQQYIACRSNETERKLVNRHLALAHTLNRSMHMTNVWKSLWSGDLQVIVMDRGYWSTLVYQGILEGDEQLIELIDDMHQEIDVADLNFIITCTPEEQQRRIDKRTSNDAFDELAKEALIGYENLIIDQTCTMFTYSKAFQIQKRAQLTRLPNHDGDEQKNIDLIISLVEHKLTFAKYDVAGKNANKANVAFDEVEDDF